MIKIRWKQAHWCFFFILIKNVKLSQEVARTFILSSKTQDNTFWLNCMKRQGDQGHIWSTIPLSWDPFVCPHWWPYSTRAHTNVNIHSFIFGAHVYLSKTLPDVLFIISSSTSLNGYWRHWVIKETFVVMFCSRKRNICTEINRNICAAIAELMKPIANSKASLQFCQIRSFLLRDSLCSTGVLVSLKKVYERWALGFITMWLL